MLHSVNFRAVCPVDFEKAVSPVSILERERPLLAFHRLGKHPKFPNRASGRCHRKPQGPRRSTSLQYWNFLVGQQTATGLPAMRAFFQTINLGQRRPRLAAIIAQLKSGSAYDVAEVAAEVGEIIAKGWETRAFVSHCNCFVNGATGGPLRGLTFTAKDNYNVAGFPTGFGNPDWLASHPVPTVTAAAVQVLLDAGATLVSKSNMDELAFSLAGENATYGTPLNPAAPTRVPGGSSSGSASAVASGLVDFALGSDTAGSVRVPAGHCGILGFRPTWGRVSMEGALPLQPSMDTVGWFARDARMLRSVGHILLTEARRPSQNGQNSQNGQAWKHPILRWLVAVDAFELADETATLATYEALAPFNERMFELLGKPEKIVLGEVLSAGPVSKWMNAIRILQMQEAWQCHGEWIESKRPNLGPGIRERFQAASKVRQPEVAQAQVVRDRVVEQMRSLLVSGAILAVPSAAGAAPLLSTPMDQLESFRQRTLTLSAIGGIAGLPQVSLPVARVQGCPVGLGLIGPHGADEALLDLAVEIMDVLHSNSRSKYAL